MHLGDEVHERLHHVRSYIDGTWGIVNLEGPVANYAAEGEGLRLHNDPAGVPPLQRAGVRVCGIANNHALDWGEAGVARTIEAVRAQSLVPVGLDAGAPVVEIGSRRVAITAHDLSGGPIEGLAAELARARASADLSIAMFHVTGPPSYVPRPELRAAVDAAIAAGALVVVAHGTHVVGPVERRGDAVIAWGLGNLLFSCDCTGEVDGAILRVSIDGSTVGARIIPIDAGLRGGPARPAHDPALMLDLFEAIGSTPLTRWRGSAYF